MPTVDGPRVVADLKRLAEFGRYKTGVHRPTYSPVDIESRRWLAEKFREAGLETVIDGIGNVIGRNPGARRPPLGGSPSETHPPAATPPRSPPVLPPTAPPPATA